jgi:hypothetical protein
MTSERTRGPDGAEPEITAAAGTVPSETLQQPGPVRRRGWLGRVAVRVVTRMEDGMRPWFGPAQLGDPNEGPPPPPGPPPACGSCGQEISRHEIIRGREITRMYCPTTTDEQPT